MHGRYRSGLPAWRRGQKTDQAPHRLHCATLCLLDGKCRQWQDQHPLYSARIACTMRYLLEPLCISG